MDLGLNVKQTRSKFNIYSRSKYPIEPVERHLPLMMFLFQFPISRKTSSLSTSDELQKKIEWF